MGGGSTWAVSTGNGTLAGPITAFTDYAVDNLATNSAGGTTTSNVDITKNDLAANGVAAFGVNSLRSVRRTRGS